MKWYRPIAIDGDTRFITRFAWLPVKMSDGLMTVWLETYKVEQMWDGEYWETIKTLPSVL